MYPRWLNVVAVIVLTMFPLGLVAVIAGFKYASAVFLLAFSLGVWVFGGVARRHRMKATTAHSELILS